MGFSTFDLNLGQTLPFLRTVLLDEIGLPRVLEVATSSTGAAADANIGRFLKLANNELSVASASPTAQSIVNQMFVPVSSFLRPTSFSAPATLVPVWLSADGVRFYVYNDASSNFAFKDFHEGLVITSSLGGAMAETTPKALVVNVASDGSFADTFLMNEFSAEDTSRTVLQFDLTLSNAGGFNYDSQVSPPQFDSAFDEQLAGPSPLVDPATWQSVTLTLTANSIQTSAATVTTGWRRSDVGKTIVIHGATASGSSILLMSYSSADTMQGVIVKDVGFNTHFDATSVSLFSAITEWSMYDYRAWVALQDSMVGDEASIGLSVNGDLLDVTVTDGSGILDASSM